MMMMMMMMNHTVAFVLMALLLSLAVVTVNAGYPTKAKKGKKGKKSKDCPVPVLGLVNAVDAVDVQISSLTPDNVDDDDDEVSADAANSLAVGYLVSFDGDITGPGEVASAKLLLYIEELKPAVPTELELDVYALLEPFNSDDPLVAQISQLLTIVDGPVVTSVGQEDSEDPSPLLAGEFVEMDVTSAIDAATPGYFIFASANAIESVEFHGISTSQTDLAPALVVTYTDDSTVTFPATTEAIMDQTRPFDDISEGPLIEIGTVIVFETQALLRFEDAVAPSSEATAATLRLWVTSSTETPVHGYRLLVDWDETSTSWSTFSNDGPVAGVHYEMEPSFTISAAELDKFVTVDVSTTVAYWTRNPNKNFGWIFINSGPDGFDFATSESGATTAPTLTIAFVE